MKILKYIILWLLLLIVFVITSTFALKVFDIIFKLGGWENIWITGYKTGLVAWIIMLVWGYFNFIKNKENN